LDYSLSFLVDVELERHIIPLLADPSLVKPLKEKLHTCRKNHLKAHPKWFGSKFDMIGTLSDELNGTALAYLRDNKIKNILN